MQVRGTAGGKRRKRRLSQQGDGVEKTVSQELSWGEPDSPRSLPLFHTPSAGGSGRENPGRRGLPASPVRSFRHRPPGATAARQKRSAFHSSVVTAASGSKDNYQLALNILVQAGSQAQNTKFGNLS